MITHKERIKRIALLDESEQKLAIEEFIADNLHTAKVFTRKILRNYMGRDTRFEDDVYSILLESMLKNLTRGIDDPQWLEHCDNWMSIWYRDSKAKARQFIDKNRSSVSGTVTINRRNRSAHTFSQELATLLGRIPTDDEVISYANAKILASNPDAKSQSRLISQGDLYPLAIESFENLGNELQVPDPLGWDQDYLAHPMETRDFIISVVKRCAEVDPTLAKFAALWLEEAMAGDIDSPVRTYICRTMQISRARFAELLERAREVAMQAAIDEGHHMAS